MSKITERARRLWRKFRDKEYREAFVEGALSDSVAVQIYSMRQNRGWTQKQLAERLDTGQTAISRLESGDNPPTLTSLLKVASAFDVAVIVKFVPFSEFLLGDGLPIDRQIKSFDDDRLGAPRPQTGSAYTQFNVMFEKPNDHLETKISFPGELKSSPASLGETVQ